MAMTCGDCMRGACINGSCVCDSGWSGHADFQTQDLRPWGGPVLSCPTSIVGVKIAWSLPLPMIVVVWIRSIVCLVDQWRAFAWQQRAAHRVPRWYHSMPVCHFVLMVFGVYPCAVGLCLTKLISTDSSEVVSVTPAASILFTSMRVCVAMGFGFHMQNAARLSLKNGIESIELDRTYLISSTVMWTCQLVKALASLLPVIALATAPTDEGFHELVYDVFMAVTSAVYCTAALWSVHMWRSLNATFERMLLRQSQFKSSCMASARVSTRSLGPATATSGATSGRAAPSRRAASTKARSSKPASFNNASSKAASLNRASSTSGRSSSYIGTSRSPSHVNHAGEKPPGVPPPTCSAASALSGASSEKKEPSEKKSVRDPSEKKSGRDPSEKKSETKSVRHSPVASFLTNHVSVPSPKRRRDYAERLLNIKKRALQQQAGMALHKAVNGIAYLLFLTVPALRLQATYLIAVQLNMYTLLGLKVSGLYMRSTLYDVLLWMGLVLEVPGSVRGSARAGSQRAASQRDQDRPRPVRCCSQDSSDCDGAAPGAQSVSGKAPSLPGTDMESSSYITSMSTQTKKQTLFTGQKAGTSVLDTVASDLHVCLHISDSQRVPCPSPLGVYRNSDLDASGDSEGVDSRCSVSPRRVRKVEYAFSRSRGDSRQ